MSPSKRSKEEIALLKAKGPRLKPGETQQQLDDICQDCNSAHFGYMTHGDIWKEARLIPSDACCRTCLEERLQRRLKFADYDWRFPINMFLPFSFEDSGLLLLLRTLSVSLNKPESAFDAKLEEVKEARRLHPNGMTMPESTDWLKNNLFGKGRQVVIQNWGRF